MSKIKKITLNLLYSFQLKFLGLNKAINILKNKLIFLLLKNIPSIPFVPNKNKDH